MADDLKQTVRILVQRKVEVDERGRSVWVAPIETAELELVSTTMLRRVLNSDDEERKRKIKAAAEGKDGVLAHNAADDSFRIVDDADLKAAMSALEKEASSGKPADVIYEPLSKRADNEDEELSLVSTLALRRILKIEDDPPEVANVKREKSFNPYDSG